MVAGLTVFREHFAAFTTQYILIGGTAASLTMEEAGLDFRATKDLDIVLHVEALTPEFGAAFWQFIKMGGYEIRQVSGSEKPIFYRFQKPSNRNFPAMVELFARAPIGLALAKNSRCTPIPFDEAITSLSAILLDHDYYAFILNGVRTIAGLPLISEDRLIPLKAIAWLELAERKAQGANVDASDVRKHLNDVLRLAQLLTPTTAITLNQKISDDLRRFLSTVRDDKLIDLRALQIANTSLTELIGRIARAYGINLNA